MMIRYPLLTERERAQAYVLWRDTRGCGPASFAGDQTLSWDLQQSGTVQPMGLGLQVILYKVRLLELRVRCWQISEVCQQTDRVHGSKP